MAPWRGNSRCHVRGNWDVNGNVDDESRTRTNCSFVRASEISSCSLATWRSYRATRAPTRSKSNSLLSNKSRKIASRIAEIRFFAQLAKRFRGQLDKHSPNRRNFPLPFIISVTKFAESTDLFRGFPSSNERVPAFSGGEGRSSRRRWHRGENHRNFNYFA